MFRRAANDGRFMKEVTSRAGRSGLEFQGCDALVRSFFSSFFLLFAPPFQLFIYFIYYKYPRGRSVTEGSGLKQFVKSWRNNALSVMATLFPGKPFQSVIATGRRECRCAVVSRDAGQFCKGDTIGKSCKGVRMRGIC